MNAGMQRDNFAVERFKYRDMFDAKCDRLTQKMVDGEEFDEEDASLYSMIMETNKVNLNRNEGPASLDSYASKSTNRPLSQRSINRDLAPRGRSAGPAPERFCKNPINQRSHSHSGGAVGAGHFPKGGGVDNSGGARRTIPPPRPSANQKMPIPTPKPKEANPECPPAGMLQHSPDGGGEDESETAWPWEDHVDFRPSSRRRAINEHAEPETAERPSTLNADAASFIPTPVSVVDRNALINEQILKTNLAKECRAIVTTLRPPKELRFNGDLNRFDFETHLVKYERAMKQEGVTDEIRVHELPFWFSGVALKMIDMYSHEEDCTKQMKQIMTKLKSKYGHKADTLENLLDKILKGNVVKDNDQKNLDLLICELEEFVINAEKTGRTHKVDTTDIITRIIIARFPSCMGRWAKKKGQKWESWDGKDVSDRELTLEDFIKFLSTQAINAEILQGMKKKKDDKEKGANNGANKPASKDSSKPKAAAVNTTGAAPANNNAGKKKNGRQTPFERNDAKKSVQNALNNGKFGAFTKPPKVEAKWAPPAAVAKKGDNKKGNGNKGRNNNNNHTANDSGNSATVNASAGNNANPNGNQSRPANRPSAPSSTAPPKFACVYCKGNSEHRIDECPAFQKASFGQKHVMMRVGGHCYKCFLRGHKAVDCDVESLRCDKCELTNHHTVFHREQRQNNEA